MPTCTVIVVPIAVLARGIRCKFKTSIKLRGEPRRNETIAVDVLGSVSNKVRSVDQDALQPKQEMPYRLNVR